jgi:signal transduction histidine kinase/sensor domain CHASE-containing protein
MLLLYGAAVMAGWVMGQPTVMDAGSHLATVWFSTALGIALAGVPLIALGREYRRISIWAATALALVSLVALAESVFHASSGLDTWRLPQGDLTPGPGRTSSITAIALFLAASAERLLAAARLERRHPPIIVALGAVPLLVGLTVLFDYAIGSANLSMSGSAVRLAPLAAVGVTVLGLGIIACGWRESQRVEPGIPRWLPFYATVTMLLATAAVASAVRGEDVAHRKEQALLATASLREAVELELDAGRNSFDRMAARAAAAMYPTHAAWEADASMMVAHAEDPYTTVYLLDATLTPLAVAPRHGATLPTRDEMLSSPVRRRALEQALQTGNAAMSARLAIAPGIRGFVLAAPIRSPRGHAVTGVIAAELAYEPLLHRALNRSPYAVQIFEGTELVYSQNDDVATADATTSNVQIAGDSWQVTLKPTRASAGLGGSLWGVLVVFGVLLSGSLGWSLQQARGLAGWARRIRDANDQLSAEISDRERAEHELRDTSRLQQAILDSANYIIVSIDVEGRIRTFNRAAERLLGQPAEEAIGQPLVQFLDADEVDRRAAQLSAELSRPIAPGLDTVIARVRPGEPDTSEWTHISRDGRRFPGEVSVNAIAEATGEVIGYLAITIDLSKRRHAELLRRWAEESLRKTEQMLHRVLDSSLSGVLAATAIRDVDGQISDFEVLLINPAAEHQLRKSATELVGRSLHGEMPGDTDGTMFTTLVEVVEGGKPYDIERASTRDGLDEWFRIIAVPLDDGVAITFENITARKQAQEELAQYVADLEISRDQIHEQSVMLQWQAEELTRARDEALAGTREMERAVKMQADFVSFASHQLRTPLAGIKWLLELALEEPTVVIPDHQELQSYLADSLSSAERLIGLVNDLLDISRLEGGRMVVAPSRVDFAALCREVAAELGPNMAQRRHTLTVRGFDDPVHVKVDPQLVRQLVHNLLSNALKYTPDGGQIGLSLETDGNELRCIVEDSGIGVPEAARGRLFEKFFRADNVQTMETEGTGLGLFMVRLILEKFGGRIWYDPRETVPGSRFTFALPVNEDLHVAA